MAVIPQTPSVYDVLLFFALCQTARQALILSILTHVLQWSVIYLGPYVDQNAYYDSLAQLSVWIIHIPILSLVMLRSDVKGRLSGPIGIVNRKLLWLPAKALDLSLIFLLSLAFALNLWISA